MCDTMVALGVATTGEQTIFAKNSDRPPGECQPLVQVPARSHPSGATAEFQYVSIPQVAATHAHVGSRPHWCHGYEHGFNEHQVVIGNEAVGSHFEFSMPKLIGMEILRIGLERGRTAAEAVAAMTAAIAQAGQGRFDSGSGPRTYDNSYIVADPNEAYVVEAAGHEWAVERVAGTRSISNVYSIGAGWESLSPTAVATVGRHGWSAADSGRLDFAASFTDPERATAGARGRYARSTSVLQQKSGRVTPATLMDILRDHSDGADPAGPFDPDHLPGSAGSRGICMHAAADGSLSNTAASLVADLCADGSRLPVYWCGFGSPCLGVFLPYFSEGALPPELAFGGATDGNDSPWWLFHRLAGWALEDPATRVPEVRRRWRGLQETLLDSAYAVAGDAREQLDAGQAESAAARLTEYMAANLRAAGTIARDLLGEPASG
jgi:secernin